MANQIVTASICVSYKLQMLSLLFLVFSMTALRSYILEIIWLISKCIIWNSNNKILFLIWIYANSICGIVQKNISRLSIGQFSRSWRYHWTPFIKSLIPSSTYSEVDFYCWCRIMIFFSIKIIEKSEIMIYYFINYCIFVLINIVLLITKLIKHYMKPER